MKTPWESIAKIEVAGEHSGTGVVVARNLVLTAFHVVADLETGFPCGEIVLRFSDPSTPGDFSNPRTVSAKLLADQSYRLADVALLECSEDLPSGHRPIPLSCECESGEVCCTPGFPVAKPSGITIHGHITSPNDPMEPLEAGVIAIGVKLSLGDGVRLKGFSGTPVFCQGTVVGIVRTALLENEQGVGSIVHAARAQDAVSKCRLRCISPVPPPAWWILPALLPVVLWAWWLIWALGLWTTTGLLMLVVGTLAAAATYPGGRFTGWPEPARRTLRHIRQWPTKQRALVTAATITLASAALLTVSPVVTAPALTGQTAQGPYAFAAACAWRVGSKTVLWGHRLCGGCVDIMEGGAKRTCLELSGLFEEIEWPVVVEPARLMAIPARNEKHACEAVLDRQQAFKPMKGVAIRCKDGQSIRLVVRLSDSRGEWEKEFDWCGQPVRFLFDREVDVPEDGAGCGLADDPVRVLAVRLGRTRRKGTAIAGIRALQPNLPLAFHRVKALEWEVRRP